MQADDGKPPIPKRQAVRLQCYSLHMFSKPEGQNAIAGYRQSEVSGLDRRAPETVN
jgi:hypothetical protein